MNEVGEEVQTAIWWHSSTAAACLWVPGDASRELCGEGPARMRALGAHRCVASTCFCDGLAP